MFKCRVRMTPVRLKAVGISHLKSRAIAHVGQDKPKGFAFVEFEEEEDAMAAMDNMNNSELYGRVLTVNVAKAQAMNRYRAIWEEKADEWIEGNKGVVEQDAASDSE